MRLELHQKAVYSARTLLSYISPDIPTLLGKHLSGIFGLCQIHPDRLTNEDVVIYLFI